MSPRLADLMTKATTMHWRHTASCAATSIGGQGVGSTPGPHPLPVQDPTQMVDLVGDQSPNAALQPRDPSLPVDVLMRNVDHERARHHAAHVEEAEGSLVLLIGLR